MPASNKSPVTGASSQPVVAQFFGIFHGIPHEGFVNIVNAAPFGACNLLILAFVHSVKTTPFFIARFNNGRDNNFPNGTPPDTDLERVALVVNRARALNPAIKILLSLGYDRHDLSNAVSTPKQFADSIARLVQTYELDGFDIDYESAGGVTGHQIVTLVQAVKESLGKVTPKRDMILTVTPAGSGDLDKSALEAFTYVMPQYYGGVPAPGDDWYAKQLGSFDRIVYGLSSEPPTNDPVAFAVPARTNGAAGLFAWRLDTGPFICALRMRRLMANGTLLSSTPNKVGAWQWTPIPPPGQPANWIDVSCAGTGSALRTVAVGSDFSLWATIFTNGNWGLMYDVRKNVSGGPSAFTKVACSGVVDKSQQVVGLGVAGLGSDGLIYCAFQHADNTWASQFFPSHTIQGTLALDVACATTEEGLLAIALNDANRLFLSTWHLDNGQWDGFQLIDLANGPPEFIHVACAATPKGLQIVAAGQDPDTHEPNVLFHRVRDTNGLWQPYQRVKDLARDCPTQVIYSACVSTQEGLHVVVAANDSSLWHSVCGTDGKWQPFQCVAPNTLPNFVSLGCGTWAGQGFQVVGVNAP